MEDLKRLLGVGEFQLFIDVLPHHRRVERRTIWKMDHYHACNRGICLQLFGFAVQTVKQFSGYSFMRFVLSPNEHRHKIISRNSIDSSIRFVLDCDSKPTEESVSVVKAFGLIDIAKLIQVGHNERGPLKDCILKII